MRRRNELALLPKLPLLTTESADEFDALRDAFEREIEPRGIIEQMYVHEFCSIAWETLRFRRAKAAIINAAFRDALVHVLTECLKRPGLPQPLDLAHQVPTLALAWFKNEQGKKRVAKTLNESGFDEYAIEGEAIRRSSSALELLNRMLASLEARRDKALRCIGEYRDGWGRQLRGLSDRMIEGQDVPELVHASSEESAA
jgi:hypothetical protein